MEQGYSSGKDDWRIAEIIVSLVCNKMGIGDYSVNRALSLQRLGMDGDDAVSFMTEFAEKFHVDMRHFDSKKHFGSEGIWPAGLWIKQIPITIADLVEAARSGVWPERTT